MDDDSLVEVKERINELDLNLRKRLKEVEDKLKIIELKCNEKIDYKEVGNIEERVLAESKKQQQILFKKMAEKEELRATIKHFDQLIKNIHEYIKERFDKFEENDDALLQKKPYAGIKCASCEKGLKNISGMANEFYTWNKMPNRDPVVRIGGQGFSKILSMLKPV